MKRKIRTKARLAQELEMSRTTLNKILSLPGAPVRDAAGYWDVSAVLSFTQMNSERLLTRQNPEIAKLRARELTVKCRRLEHRLLLETGKFVEVSCVQAAIDRQVRCCRQVLEAIPRKAAMSCAGRTPAEIEKVLDAEVREAMRQLHENPWPFATPRKPSPLQPSTVDG